ncbi:MAG: DUF4142 domain-containing protein [Rubrivivax sp.]|nr:MAG: DUF4142 domain-containing protein [Rubrivivax sp.]
MPSSRLGFLISAALACGLQTLAPAALAQTTTPENTTAGTGKSGAISAEDRSFVMRAATGGMAEVQLGELAQRNGASSTVKQFGAQMVRDHGQANDELKRLASTKGVQLSTQLDPEHRALSERLQKLSGAEFDRAYIQAMRDAHVKDVSLFEQQAQAGRDSDLKAFAQKTLPTLRQHLQHVQGLAGPANAASR